MKTSTLKTILGIEHSIISAPMANAAGGLLATEVTKAGGLGLIGGGYCDSAWVTDELSKVAEGEFGIGFITWRLMLNPKLLSLALQKKPKAVMLSFGDIEPFVEEIKSANVPLICQIQTVDQAMDCVKKGADIIVAQGTEAGGHGATCPAASLIPAVINAVTPIPVVAAGGICDALDIKNALSLGASGVLMGTRFLASEESLASAAAKERLLSAKGEDTVRTNVFDYARGYDWPKPYTARAIKNNFTKKWHDTQNAKDKINVDVQQDYAEAVNKNDFDEAAIFAGEGVGNIDEILSASRIIEKLFNQ